MVLRIVGIVIAVLVGLWIVGQVLNFLVPVLVVAALLAVGYGGYRMLKSRSQREIGR